ncbi:endoribonuclease YbeY-like isoform X2 [Amphiura filiformis]|uniref:endoribonuclease YbeY-like isoform X2 n=1 Tax=Amphiura filiformis TaxID=82378 RepID=UPI003B20EC11
MSLILRSVQKTPSFNFNKLRDDIVALRRIMRVDRFELAVVCMDEPQVRELNKLYNGRDEPTDVLSFPRYQNLKPGKLPDPWSDVNDLGDIYLGISSIQAWCEKNHIDLDTGLPLVVTHGLCKLIGYKDDSLGQWKQMYEKEMDIIKKFNKATGGHVPLRPATPPIANDVDKDELISAMS